MTAFDADAKYVEQVLALYSDPHDITAIKKHLPGVLALYSEPFKAEVFKYMDAILDGFVIVERDVHGADGRLRIERGAIGVAVMHWGGWTDVFFDDTPHFVELDGSGLRNAEVPDTVLSWLWLHLRAQNKANLRLASPLLNESSLNKSSSS